MRKKLTFFTCILFLFFSCSKKDSQIHQFVIGASVAPYNKLLTDIFDPYVKVVSLLEKNQIEEDVDISLHKIALLSTAQFYFSMDLPIEEVLKHKGLFHSKDFIYLNKKIPRLFFENTTSFVAEDKDSSLTLDPHIWMSPSNMIQMLSIAVEKVSETFPTYKKLFYQNFMGIKKHLEREIKEIKEILKKRKSKDFLIFHPSLGHFANEFGLKQLALEKEGKEISIKQMLSIMSYIKVKKIPFIFLQTQYNMDVVQKLKENLALKIIRINPLDKDYFHQLQIIKQTLRDY
jgi:zinc transport system substrate-binding protein